MGNSWNMIKIQKLFSGFNHYKFNLIRETIETKNGIEAL